MPSRTRTSVAPCSSCGDLAGYVRYGYSLPARYDATRWGGAAGACHECFGRMMREHKSSAEPQSEFARGGAARFLPVQPCGLCGTSAGYTPPNQSRPARCDGSKYGLAPLCSSCAEKLRCRQKRGVDIASIAGPNHAQSRMASREGWEGRYVEVRAGMLTDLGVAYEECDRDPLTLPYRAAPRSDLESASAQKTVEAMRVAWEAGDMERLREVVFGKDEIEVEQEAVA